MSGSIGNRPVFPVRCWKLGVGRSMFAFSFLRSASSPFQLFSLSAFQHFPPLFHQPSTLNSQPYLPRPLPPNLPQPLPQRIRSNDVHMNTEASHPPLNLLQVIQPQPDPQHTIRYLSQLLARVQPPAAYVIRRPGVQLDHRFHNHHRPGTPPGSTRSRSFKSNIRSSVTSSSKSRRLQFVRCRVQWHRKQWVR